MTHPSLDPSLDPEVHRRLSILFELAPRPDKVDFINHLALEINHLILTDFPGLVQKLYRLDVDEDRLRSMLKQYVHDDAGYIIAQLIIERETQKVKAMNKK